MLVCDKITTAVHITDKLTVIESTAIQSVGRSEWAAVSLCNRPQPPPGHARCQSDSTT
ncbi:MAG: hypothetical protein NVS4B6_27920 [Mycobacterium sp.]